MSLQIRPSLVLAQQSNRFQSLYLSFIFSVAIHNESRDELILIMEFHNKFLNCNQAELKPLKVILSFLQQKYFFYLEQFN